MLSIIFNRGSKDIEDANYVFSPDTYFKYNFEDEWFEDELVKEMVLDVDRSVVVSAHSIDSPVLGLIAPERLSGGVKALIIMYKEPDLIVNASTCGNNCAKWILETRKKDSDCYFVFITRDGLNMLPYSVNEIYYLKNSGYYQNTRQIYNSMHQVYPETDTFGKIVPSIVLTEDSNAGYEMYKAIFQDVKVPCDSAGGK